MKLHITVEFEFDVVDRQSEFNWIQWLADNPRWAIEQLAKAHDPSDFDVLGYHGDDCGIYPCSCGLIK